MKRPAFQFYPADWRKDSALQSCSIAAQGLWINMMCIAHECDPYGHLSVNGKPMLPERLSRLVGLPTKECCRYLKELEDAGVYSVAENGSIYSRRMVNDERLRTVRADAGRLGGNPSLLGKKVNQKDNQTPKQTPTPSSSSSSSSSAKEKASAFALPDWVPAEPWKAWLEVRKRMKAPNTDYALGCAVKDLERLRDAGDDPQAVLDRSTSRGWRGLFPLNGTGSNAMPDYSALYDKLGVPHDAR